MVAGAVGDAAEPGLAVRVVASFDVGGLVVVVVLDAVVGLPTGADPVVGAGAASCDCPDESSRVTVEGVAVVGTAVTVGVVAVIDGDVVVD